MKSKTINKVITKKIREWTDTITDPILKKRVLESAVVTGGCITSMLLNEDVNDYDVYLKDKQVVYDLAKYYCDQFQNDPKNSDRGAYVITGIAVLKWKDGRSKLKSLLPKMEDVTYNEYCAWLINREGDYTKSFDNTCRYIRDNILKIKEDRVCIVIPSEGIMEEQDSIADDVEFDVEQVVEECNGIEDKEPYRPIFLSNNAITLSNKIQIIIRFYGDVEELHSNYDFVHCTNYWTLGTGVVLNKEALECILNKELKYIGSKYPLCSVVRTRKFIKRGWQINAGQYVKMLYQISKLNLDDPEVFEEQLVGVDSVYFRSFIEALNTKQRTDPTFSLDYTYLSTVLDKIFD